jgi:hypothetical protein
MQGGTECLWINSLDTRFGGVGATRPEGTVIWAGENTRRELAYEGPVSNFAS